MMSLPNLFTSYVCLRAGSSVSFRFALCRLRLLCLFINAEGHTLQCLRRHASKFLGIADVVEIAPRKGDVATKDNVGTRGDICKDTFQEHYQGLVPCPSVHEHVALMYVLGVSLRGNRAILLIPVNHKYVQSAQSGHGKQRPPITAHKLLEMAMIIIAAARQIKNEQQIHPILLRGRMWEN